MAFNVATSAGIIVAGFYAVWWVWRHQHDQELCRWCGRPAGFPPNAEHVHWVHDQHGSTVGAHRWAFCSARCLRLSLATQPQEEGTPQ